MTRTIDPRRRALPRDEWPAADRAAWTAELDAKARPGFLRQSRAAGLDPDASRDELAAYSDVAFQALRHEFGLVDGSRPHWKPAIRAVRSGQTLREILGDPKIVRALVDPSYRGWHRLGMMANKVTYTELRPAEGFMKRILD